MKARLTGIAIAVLLSSSRGAVQRAFYPRYAIFFQTVPLIAVAPLLVIWFGFGLRTVIASAFVASVFPVIANTLSGILSTDPNLRDLFKLYGASPLVTLFEAAASGSGCRRCLRDCAYPPGWR